jgi:hypothetical protein
MGRLRAADLIAAAGAVALLLSAAVLDWYSGATAWEAFSVLDVVLAALALVPLGLAIAQASRSSPAIPVLLSVLTTLAGALAVLLIGYRMLNEPGPDDAVALGIGAWVGLAAALAIAGGGWASMRDESMPGRSLPPVDDLPAPAP